MSKEPKINDVFPISGRATLRPENLDIVSINVQRVVEGCVRHLLDQIAPLVLKYHLNPKLIEKFDEHISIALSYLKQSVMTRDRDAD